jgi:nucleotide-binding universal stress UspA family protein
MHRVLVPVDENVQRATRQAEFVTSMPGVPDELQVKVIHVDPADYEGAKPTELEDIEAATVAHDRIEDAGIECDNELWEGVIAENILEAARDFNADQIVMSGRDRSGVAKVILGSVTQDVAVSTDRPVTILG